MRFANKQLITREVDTKTERLNEFDKRLGLRAADSDRIKQLVRDLNDGGTGDAQRALLSSVAEAKGDIHSRFEAEHDETAREQGEAERLEQDISDEARSEVENAERITEAQAELHTDEAQARLDTASTELLEEADALDAESERMQVRREKSLREVENLLRRVCAELD